MPGRGINMGDGWETKRRRGPGNDWVIVKLARPGTIERVEIDTIHFKGNAPGSFMLEGCVASGDGDVAPDAGWVEIMEQTPLQPDSFHVFEGDRVKTPAHEFTHARLSIYPDGGVSRLHLFGRARA
jgi:allantoicase